MSDKILESGTVHVQDIQMGKKKMSDVKIANDEVLFIIFYQGRGIINAFGEEIFMSEKEYVMIQGATGRDKISVHAEYPDHDYFYRTFHVRNNHAWLPEKSIYENRLNAHQ